MSSFDIKYIDRLMHPNKRQKVSFWLRYSIYYKIRPSKKPDGGWKYVQADGNAK